MRRGGLAGVVWPIMARSQDVPWTRPISLLFVDGLHDYGSVRVDVDHFAPHVVHGGYVVFHDAGEEGPRRVIEEMLATAQWQQGETCEMVSVLEKV